MALGPQPPGAAGFAATAALTVLTLVIAALSLARILERDRREDVLQANAFSARSLAGLISLELGQSVQAVERLAADPRVISRLDEPPGAFPAAIEEVRSQESFVTIALLDTAGMAIARSPLPPDSGYFNKDWWGWTDHFVEARRRGELGRHQGYYVFVVQTRASASEDVVNDRLVWLLEWAGLPLLLGTLTINLLLFFFRRRTVP